MPRRSNKEMLAVGALDSNRPMQVHASNADFHLEQ